MNSKRLQEYYTSEYSKKQLCADLARKDRLRFLFTDNPANKKILDVGCRPAVDIRFLFQDNEVHGVDISDAALDIAKKRSRLLLG